MKTLVSGGALVTRCKGDLFLTHTNVLSLQQWMNALGDCVLMLPFIDVDEVPGDQDRLEPTWNVVEQLNCANSYPVRKRQSLECVGGLNPSEFEMAYCRMPAIEAWWGFQFANKHNIPVITELHGDWKEAFLAQPASNPARRLISVARAHWSARVFKTMSRNSVGVSCIGPKLQKLYVPADTPALITTNHTVNESDYQPRDDVPKNEPPVLVFIGELQKRKGLHNLFPALKQVLEKSFDFKLLVFGDGGEELGLKQLANELKIADKIEFRGYVANGRDLFAPLHGADAFILPSIAAEGVPRANHEAMAMGCPVIATDIGSTDWQLRDDGGIIVKPNDVDDLANKICKVLGDADLRKRLSENGFRNAQQHTYEIQSAGIAEFVNGL